MTLEQFLPPPTGFAKDFTVKRLRHTSQRAGFQSALTPGGMQDPS